MDRLVTILTDQISEMKSKVIEKEKKLERLFKLTSKTISDYDVETAELVERLHKALSEEVGKASHFHFTHCNHRCSCTYEDLVALYGQRSKSSIIKVFIFKDCDNRDT